MTEWELFQRLGVALGLGLLIGVERGWAVREAGEGTRAAGLRTFGLIGILGAAGGLLAQQTAPLALGFFFMGLTGLLGVAYWCTARELKDYGITTEVAALLTFILGALTMFGFLEVAAGAAVVTSVLLGLKPVLHRWLLRLHPEELFAAQKLLLISVVLLPVLPDRDFGPWQVLNPYRLWWMVVLVAAISFLGYIAVRIMGTRRGVILTGLFGGMTSSTAVTLHLSRLGRRTPELQGILAAGVMAASATMFPRMLLVVGVVQPGLLASLAWPLGLMALAGYLAAVWQWRVNPGTLETSPLPLSNPFEIQVALQFGGFLAVVMVLAKVLQHWLGDAGLYLISGIAGTSDVDAISLSLSKLVSEGLARSVAAQAIVLAAMVNTLVKGGIAMVVGGGGLGWRVAGAVLGIVFSGAIGLVVAP